MKIHSRAVWASLAIGCTLSLLGGLLVRHFENDAIEAQFRADAKEKLAAVGANINQSFSVLDYVRFIFEGSEGVTPEEFRRIFSRFQGQSRVLRGVAWAPLVVRPPGSHPRYALPIEMVEPRGLYATMRGADLAENPSILEAAEKVLTGKVPVQLVAGHGTGESSENLIAILLAQRPDDQGDGLILASLNMPSLLRQAIESTPVRGTAVELRVHSSSFGEKGFSLSSRTGRPVSNRIVFRSPLDSPTQIPI